MYRISIACCFVAIVALGCRSSDRAMQRLQADQICIPDSELVIETIEVDSIAEARSIEEYVHLGLSQNPAINEAFHKIEAIQHRIPQALSLPDPMVNTSTYLAPVQTASGEQNFALGLSQKFTNIDRRATRAAVSLNDVAIAEANLRRIELEIGEGIRIACYQLTFVREAIEITQEDLESLRQIAEVIQRQYEVKRSVTQQDVMNVQIEQSKVENELTTLRQKELSFQARLARLLHVAPHSDLEIQTDPKDTFRSFDLDAMIAEAMIARPELQSQLAAIDRNQKMARLASLENKPDFTLGLNWIATSSDGISPVANGDDALLLNIGFNLPVYKNRIRAAVCEANANRRASASKYESLKDDVATELFDLVSQAESIRETLALLQEDIIPKSRRTLDISIDEYSSGKTEYVQLVANWRALLRYRIAESRMKSQFSQTMASMERSIGRQTPHPE